MPSLSETTAQWLDTARQLTELLNENERSASVIKGLRADLDGTHSSLQEARQTIEEQQTYITSLSDTIASLREDNRRLDVDAYSADKELWRENQALRNEVNRLTADLTVAQSYNVPELQGQIISLQSRITQLESAGLQLSQENRELTEGRKRAMENVCLLSTECNQKAQQITELSAKLKTAQSLAECYKNSASATVLEQMQQKYQALLNTHHLLEEKCDSLQSSLNIRRKQLDEINQISGDHGA